MDLNYKEKDTFNTNISNPFENISNNNLEETSQSEHSNQQQYYYEENQSRDYSKYFAEENRLRELLAIKQKRRKIFQICMTIITIILMIALALFVQIKSKSSILNTYILKHNNLEKFNEKDNNILVEDLREDDTIKEEDNSIIDGDYVYKIINLETENHKSLVNIDSEVIEETLYKTDRLLYFKVTPKIDYVSTLINVYAYDENGNQIGQSSTRLNNIAPNQESLAQVMFKFDATKYKNVTYKSECIQFENMDYNDKERFKSDYNPYRRITNITEDEENITITVSGDNVNIPIYVVFYKDGQINRILGTYNDSMTKGTIDIVIPSYYIAHDSFTVFLS